MGEMVFAARSGQIGAWRLIVWASRPRGVPPTTLDKRSEKEKGTKTEKHAHTNEIQNKMTTKPPDNNIQQIIVCWPLFLAKKVPFFGPPSNPKTLTFDRQANSCFNPMTRRTNYRLALEISFLFILTKK